MARHALRKLLLALPLVWGVITLIFFLMELSPGSIAEAQLSPDASPEVRAIIEAKYGLDRPIHERYLRLLGDLLRFEFGNSHVSQRPVRDEILQRLPATLTLSGAALLIGWPLGIAVGVLQSVRRGKLADSALSVGSLTFYSMPSFWLALVLQLVFSLWWPIFPTSGMNDTMLAYTSPSRLEVWLDSAWHLALPSLALGLAAAASVARYTRSSMLEVLHQDYVRTARAKGLSEARVVLRHALPNALLPLITLFGLSLPVLFSGSVLIENIFAWPGMGQMIVDAIFRKDTPVVIGVFFVFSLVVIAGNLAADLAYAVADPRIRLE